MFEHWLRDELRTRPGRRKSNLVGHGPLAGVLNRHAVANIGEKFMQTAALGANPGASTSHRKWCELPLRLSLN